MFADGVKPILGLLALLALPVFGLAGRAEASFALAPSRLTTDSVASAESQRILHSDKYEEPAPSSGTGMSSEPRPFTPPPAPPTPPRDIVLANGVTQNQGASSGGVMSAGSGVGLPFVLPPDPQLPQQARGMRLCLADEGQRPPSFASRWFRPPR